MLFSRALSQAIGVLLLLSTTLGAEAPSVVEVPGATRADLNGDSRLDLADAIFLLNHVFVGGPPPLPLPVECTTAPGEKGMTLSSGLFSLPADAVSVDWAVVNNSRAAQTFTATVYRHGGMGREIVAPGALSVTIGPAESFHNANSVGTVFHTGSYYELVVEASESRVLPVVHVWDNTGNRVIPGTLISSGRFVRIDAGGGE